MGCLDSFHASVTILTWLPPSTCQLPSDLSASVCLFFSLSHCQFVNHTLDKKARKMWLLSSLRCWHLLCVCLSTALPLYPQQFKRRYRCVLVLVHLMFTTIDAHVAGSVVQLLWDIFILFRTKCFKPFICRSRLLPVTWNIQPVQC